MKSVSRMAVLALFVACLGFGAVAVAQTDGRAAWDFQGIEIGTLPETFVVKKGEPAVYIETVSGQKAVRLQKADAVVDGVLIPFAEQNNRAVLEFSAYIPTQERNLVVIVGYMPDGSTSVPTNQGVYLSFMEGGVVSYYSGKWHELGSIDTTQWIDFRIEIDIPYEAFTVYMNGSKLGTGAFRGSVDRVNAVDFSMFNNAGPGTVWVDSVRVGVLVE